MMKKIFLIIAVVAATTSLLFGGIVNNSTTSPTAEDSLSFVFYSLDSLGNPTTADSLYLLVSGPSGAVVYRDSAAISEGRVTATTIRGKQFYSFKDQVSNLDGVGSVGFYSLTVLAKNNSDDLLTPNVYSFQIVSEELSDQLALIGDSVEVKGGAIDSNRTELGSDSVYVLGGAVDSNRTELGSDSVFVLGGAVDSNRTELGNDSAMTAAWVWNTPQSNHTIPGSFGKYLDAEISSISAGSGAYSFTVQTYDPSVGMAIPYALIGMRNLDQSSLVATGKSDVAGRATFNLDAGSYLAVTTASGYIFDSFDTVVVSGAGVDTVFCDQFDPGAPSFPVLCRVYGHLFTADGTPEEDAAVSAWLPSGVARFGIAVISPSPVNSTSDSTGYFYLDLVPSDSLTPAGTKYEFSISRRDGTILRQRLSVPDSTSWRLTW